MIWFGGCVGNIAGPFFYKTDQAPTYHLGIGSLLVANFIDFLLFFVLRYAFKWENRRKAQLLRETVAAGLPVGDPDAALNATAFTDLTDGQNPNFVYVY